jgi:hypothetical protein
VSQQAHSAPCRVRPQWRAALLQFKILSGGGS